MRWRNQWEKVQERDTDALNLGCLEERRGRVVAAVAAAAVRLRAVVATEAWHSAFPTWTGRGGEVSGLLG